MNCDQFYKYRDKEGFHKLCKACLTAHVDNFDPETFLWILKDFDVPYDETRWNELRDRAFKKNPHKMNGLSVIGLYFRDMRLNQYKDKKWADSDEINAKNKLPEEEVEARKQQLELEKEIKKRYENGEIGEAEYKTFVSTETQNAEFDYEAPPEEVTEYQSLNGTLKGLMPNLEDEISQEDKVALVMKWGGDYSLSELIQLEKKYDEMCRCFDINDSDTIGSLIFICKTYLKMNNAIDANDIETYQKLSRVYESLRKSSKFTAVQKNDKELESFNSVGQLVAFCEKEGGKIPKWDLSIPLDSLDKVIIDMKKYTRDLIYEDTALSRQIEEYLKKREATDKKKNLESETLEEEVLSDEEILVRKEQIEEEKEFDRINLYGEVNENGS